MKTLVLGPFGFILIAGTLPVLAQPAGEAKAGCANKTNSNASPTAPRNGPNSGTQNMGSTAWTGVTGGSHIGTSNGSSDTGQPRTAKGVDPTKDKSAGC